MLMAAIFSVRRFFMVMTRRGFAEYRLFGIKVGVYACFMYSAQTKLWIIALVLRLPFLLVLDIVLF